VQDAQRPGGGKSWLHAGPLREKPRRS
jgi:tetraacyldisaccharide-1-P 4'-kinase